VNEFQTKYGKKIEKILAKYPREDKKAALMPLIHLAQSEDGYINRKTIGEIAAILDCSDTEVASIIGFYSLYHDQAGGKYRIQVCNDLACALRGADEFLEKLCENLAIKVGETTPDGLFTIEEVTCLAGCDHAPMLQIQSGDKITYHENLTAQKTQKIIEDIRKRTHKDEGKQNE